MPNQNQIDELADAADDIDLNQDDYARDDEWLRLARDAFTTSTDFLDGSLKAQWERNYAMFRSKHPPGSKYYSESYKARSKIFRPKTRSAVRRNEAAASKAYFSTYDAVQITAENDDDPEQVAAAAVNKELMNYRLKHSVKWFKAVIGAYQETMNVGFVVSMQRWIYKEKTVDYEQDVMGDDGKTVLDEQGNVATETVTETIMVEDRPIIELRPLENIRLDPACDWMDPINTSPYLIDMMPMYVYEVKANVASEGWRELSDEVILSAAKQHYDTTRQQREGTERRDSKEGQTSINEYQLVWVHRNIIKRDNQDWVYYTLGSTIMLSDPVTIEEAYDQTERPYVGGSCIIEAHRTYPSAPTELGAGIQNEANEIANARIDNIKLAINQRKYIRRGADIDFKNLMRSVPGGCVMMDDTANDVRAEDVRDVTSSSYQEQDRLNVDFDEIMGTFSPGSVQANRKLNETVGGMELLDNDANFMSEYQLRVFNETWVEPVLNQVLKLIQKHETDETILAIAGRKANMAKHGVEKLDMRALAEPMTLSVSVGFDSTDPRKRIEKMAIGMRTIGEFFPQVIQQADPEPVISEVFGALGFDTGKRFFPNMGEDEDPRIQQLQQQLQQLQQYIKTKQIETEGKLKIEQLKQQGANARERTKIESMHTIEEAKNRLAYIDKQLDAETNDIARSELLLEQAALEHSMRVEELRLLQGERSLMQDKITAEQDGTDDSKAGVIQRDQYGSVPFAEG